MKKESNAFALDSFWLTDKIMWASQQLVSLP